MGANGLRDIAGSIHDIGGPKLRRPMSTSEVMGASSTSAAAEFRAVSHTPSHHGRLRALPPESDMALELTAVFRKVSRGYIAFVEELPGANTQGDTLDEARANLEEAVALVLESNRALAEEELQGADVIREPLKIPAA